MTEEPRPGLRENRTAVEYGTAAGATIIEGYPVEPEPRLYTYMGSPSAFRRAGFRDETPPGQTRTVMRYVARSAPRTTRQDARERSLIAVSLPAEATVARDGGG